MTQQDSANLNINWRVFYRNVFALVVPMALQNLINVGVTAIDVVMLGKVGETALSGSSLAGQIQFIMMLMEMKWEWLFSRFLLSFPSSRFIKTAVISDA